MQGMQGGGIAKQRSIGKKKGGFLFASAAEKTPEDLRKEEEERIRTLQEDYERSLAPSLAPSSIPLATLGDDDEKDSNMATATSLRERLKQYQSLKAEQQASAQDVASAPKKAEDHEESFLGPPINKPDEPKPEPPKDTTPPDESWVPNTDEIEEGITVEEEVEYVDGQGGGGEEEEIEEELVEDDTESSVEEEYEEEEVVSERKLESSPSLDVDMDEEMDVFRALDEAEKAEKGVAPRPSQADQSKALSQSQQQQQQQPPLTASAVKSRDAMPQRDENSARYNTIICLVVFVAIIAIVAIVLPFVLDYGNRSGDPAPPTAPEPTPAPTPLEPTISPAPTITASPTSIDGEPTVSTEAPTTLRLNQFIQSFLIPISGEEVFQDTSTPQFRAAQYIAEEDPFTNELTTQEELGDRYAAITFYYATSGNDWTQCYLGDESCTQGEWLVGDICGWFAVSCDEFGRVNGFLFADPEGNNLSGTLPMELYLLTEMVDLIIVNNDLTGTLPEAFGQNSTNIRSLLLPGNSLDGTIANDYLVNSPLEVISLANNSFSNSIPTNLGGGTVLETLDLSGNRFSGSLSSDISTYSNLRELNLAGNSLEGEIPDSLYSIGTMERLLLNGNAFTGSLSGSIGRFPSLQVLNVGDTNLEGFIPDELYTLTNLIEVDLGGAAFTGQLSFGFVNLASTLRRLVVDNNSLGGTVPDSFGSLTSLNVLELHGNGFTGSISDSICRLVQEGNLDVLTADCEEITCACCNGCF